MKTRVVVWTIVGLLVVAGVIFLVTSSKRPPQVVKDLASMREQAEQVSGKLDILQADIDELRQLPGAGDEATALDGVDSMIARTRAGLDHIRTTEDVDAAFESLRESREMMQDARRAFRDAEKKLRPRPRG